jgi:hypothetical protein
MPLTFLMVMAVSAISPLPQCQERREGVLRLTDSSIAVLESDDAFSKEWLTDGINAVCGFPARPATPAYTVQSVVGISLLLPGPAQKVALQQRGMTVSPKLGQEGYVVDIDPTTGVLIAAHNRSGLFHGAQTLQQMLHVRDGSCEIDAGRIEDWPDAPMRGVYAVGSWYDAAPPGNVTFLNNTIDEMARSKHSFIMFNANGANILFAALRNPNSLSAQRTIQYYKRWQAYCADRGIELIPQINSGALVVRISKRYLAGNGTVCLYSYLYAL